MIEGREKNINIISAPKLFNSSASAALMFLTFKVPQAILAVFFLRSPL